VSDALSLTVKDVEALDEAQAQAVLDAWVKARRAELPEALARSTSKGHARLGKRALYQLKSGGVAVAEPSVPAQGGAAGAAKREELEAVLSPVLGTGERAFFFARPVRGGGLEIFQGIFSDELGLLQFEGSQTNRSSYRRRMSELHAETPARVIFVDWERVRLELGHAITLNGPAKTPLAEDVGHALRRLGVVAAPLTVDVPAPGDDDAGVAAEAGRGLHEEAEIAQWLPSEQALARLTERFTTVNTVDEKLALARAAADAFFTPPMRQHWARRLWLTAEVFERTGRPARGAQARAEARSLAHGTAPSSWAHRLFEKAVELAVSPPPADLGPAPLPMPPGVSTSR
jgi:hypothetical protein